MKMSDSEKSGFRHVSQPVCHIEDFEFMFQNTIHQSSADTDMDNGRYSCRTLSADKDAETGKNKNKMQLHTQTQTLKKKIKSRHVCRHR